MLLTSVTRVAVPVYRVGYPSRVLPERASCLSTTYCTIADPATASRTISSRLLPVWHGGRSCCTPVFGVLRWPLVVAAWEPRLDAGVGGVSDPEVLGWLGRYQGLVASCHRSDQEGVIELASGSLRSGRALVLKRSSPVAGKSPFMRRVGWRQSGGDPSFPPRSRSPALGSEPVADLRLSRQRFSGVFRVDCAAGPAAVDAVVEQLGRIPGKGVGYGVLRYLAVPELAGASQALPFPDVALHFLARMPSPVEPPPRNGPGQGDAGMAMQLCEASFGPMLNPTVQRRTRLSVRAQNVGRAVCFEFGYNPHLYRRSTTERVAQTFRRRLHAAGAAER